MPRSHSSDLVPATEDIPERVHRVPPHRPPIYHQISSYMCCILSIFASWPSPCQRMSESIANSDRAAAYYLWPVISLQKLIPQQMMYLYAFRLLRCWFLSQPLSPSCIHASNPNSGIEASSPAQKHTSLRRRIAKGMVPSSMHPVQCSTVFSARQNHNFECHDIWRARWCIFKPRSCFKWNRDLAWSRRSANGIPSPISSVKQSY